MSITDPLTRLSDNSLGSTDKRSATILIMFNWVNDAL
jgi:hypothetical protein